MRRLIRFEDAYGLADLVCLVQQLGYAGLIADKDKNNLNGINTIILSEKDETYIECGVSFPAILTLKDEWIANIIQYQIDELIIVFDMDAADGTGEIISSTKLEEFVTKIERNLKKQNLDICVRYVPAVWAAETFAMYVLLQDYKIKKKTEEFVEPTELVHKLNTPKFHAKIVGEILKHRGISERTKHLRKYISNNEIAVQGLEKALKQFKQSINERVLNWILYEDADALYDSAGVVEHQREIERYLQKHQPDANEQFIVYENVKLDFNKKCWK